MYRCTCRAQRQTSRAVTASERPARVRCSSSTKRPVHLALVTTPPRQQSWQTKVRAALPPSTRPPDPALRLARGLALHPLLLRGRGPTSPSVTSPGTPREGLEDDSWSSHDLRLEHGASTCTRAAARRRAASSVMATPGRPFISVGARAAVGGAVGRLVAVQLRLEHQPQPSSTNTPPSRPRSHPPASGLTSTTNRPPRHAPSTPSHPTYSTPSPSTLHQTGSSSSRRSPTRAPSSTTTAPRSARPRPAATAPARARARPCAAWTSRTAATTAVTTVATTEAGASLSSLLSSCALPRG